MTLTGSNALVGQHEVDGEDLQHYPLPVGVGIAAGTPVGVGSPGQVGVTIEAADDDGNACCDCDKKRWKFPVKNVTSYDASTGDEATWKAVEVGDQVYVESDYSLSLSPTDAAGADNIAFGTVCPKVWNEGDTVTAYTGTATQYTEEDVVIFVGDFRA